jgi:predicted outer membrane repeat protein
MFLLLAGLTLSRDLRTVHVIDGGDGDCFQTACGYEVAVNLILNGDTIVFEDKRISISSYPSPMSDLLHTAMFMNVTMNAKDYLGVIDGRFMAGESLFNVHSAARFCWAKFHGFTFTGFEKPVLIRIMAESPWPLIIFEKCSFLDNKQDVFNIKGGTFQFDNCVFRNNVHRPLKAVTEATVELTDCVIERSESSFFFDSDLIIHNCRFIENFGSRGGALYLSKVTLLIDGAKFIRNKAKNHGGAIYIRESGSDFECEIRRSCFVENEAGHNGTSYYAYYSDMIFRDNCFSDEDRRALFEFKTNNTKVGNEFASKCGTCLAYEPVADDFDPITPDPEFDFDVLVPPNAWVSL